MEDIEFVCRLCLRRDPGRSLQDLFGQNLISMKIMSLFQLTLMQGLNWPRRVCGSCVERLDGVCKFRKEIIDNQILIEQQFGPVILNQDPTSRPIMPTTFVVEDPTILEISNIEVEQHDQTTEFIIEEEVKVDIDAVENNARPRRTTTRSRTRPVPEVTTRSTKLDNTTDTLEVMEMDEEDPEIKDDLVEEDAISADGKQIQKHKNVDEEIRKFMTLSCSLCEATNFQTFPELRVHYTKQHRAKGYVMCCNIKHLRRHKLYEHIMFHIDPDIYKCETCGKSFNSLHNLKVHKQMQHLPEDLKSHQCEKCQRRFGTAFQLKQHLVSHIPEEEKSFKCDECSKMFPGRVHLLSHVRLVHENVKPFVCEICKHAFSSRTYLRNHLAAIHDESKEKVKCDHCGKFFANVNSMKKHLSRLNVTGEKCICNVCGHESPNKSALNGHMKRNHSEIKYAFVCSSCSKEFKTQRTLTEHMANHTGVLLYKCAFCPKQFNSNANKYSHQKKKHPEEWIESKLKKSDGIGS